MNPNTQPPEASITATTATHAIPPSEWREGDILRSKRMPGLQQFKVQYLGASLQGTAGTCFKGKVVEKGESRWAMGQVCDTFTVGAFELDTIVRFGKNAHLRASKKTAKPARWDALRKCAEQFRHYADFHRAKGTTEGADKARINADMALMCEAAMEGEDARTGGISEWGGRMQDEMEHQARIAMDLREEYRTAFEEVGRQAAVIEKLSIERDKLQAFKAYVHDRLDKAGVPVDPESPHKAEGCRIGGRLDWLFIDFDRARRSLRERLTDENIKLKAQMAEAARLREVEVGELRQKIRNQQDTITEWRGNSTALQQECERIKDALAKVAGENNHDIRELRKRCMAVVEMIDTLLPPDGEAIPEPQAEYPLVVQDRCHTITQHAVERYRERTGSKQPDGKVLNQISLQIVHAQEWELKPRFRVLELLSHGTHSRFFRTPAGLLWVVENEVVVTCHHGQADRWQPKPGAKTSKCSTEQNKADAAPENAGSRIETT